jgi:hypothetical protein
VQVRVLNGNGGSGVASSTAVSLENVGFQVNGTGDADAFTYDKTTIRYAPGAQDKAQLLKSYLSAGATLQPDSTLGTADVALVVGADFTGVRPGPAGAAVNSPTTVAPQSPPPSAQGSTQPAC